MNLQQFESLVYQRRYEEAGRALVEILKVLKVGGRISETPETDENLLKEYTRLASAISALLADPGFELSPTGFTLIALNHATLHGVYQASVFENTDHLLHLLGVPDAQRPGALNFQSNQSIMKLLLAYSLDSGMDLDFEALFRASPQQGLPAYLGMMSHLATLTPAGYSRREKLLGLSHLFGDTMLADEMLAPLSDAWMYCSYADGKHKHDLKHSMNLLLRKFMASKDRGDLPLPPERALKERPAMLVCCEWFTSVHAMFRCYAPSIRLLRKKFELVLLCRESETDEKAKQLFNRAFTINGPNVNLTEVVAKVVEIKPDVIFYPSVGMAPWFVALSNLRLAPIQIASNGHPATTRSSVMDYMIIEESLFREPSPFSETVVLLREGGMQFEMRHDAVHVPAELHAHPDIIRIAVPAMISKLNARFLALLQRLIKQSRRPLEFHFFPGMIGLHHFQFKRQIQKWLPNAVIYPRAHYNDYIRNLNRCEIQLSTFPFTGTNSNIDCLRQGIPFVTMQGNEPHSVLDAGISQRMRLPGWLLTQSEAEYEQAALRLIHDDELRMSISLALLGANNVNKVFLEEMEHSHPDDVLNAFWWVYENHEALQRDGRRVWTVAERERSRFTLGTTATKRTAR